MPADNINYRDGFVKCLVINKDGLMLDLPFPIYHQTVVENGRQHYCNLDGLEGVEVIAYIHYAIADEDKVLAFSGYLGNDWKEVQKDPDAVKHWTMTKEDALETSDGLGVVTKYDGADKAEVVHPYGAEEKRLVKEIVSAL